MVQIFYSIRCHPFDKNLIEYVVGTIPNNNYIHKTVIKFRGYKIISNRTRIEFLANYKFLWFT